jgi:hypothetical protein
LNGQHRASSASVLLNNQEVISEKSLNQTIATVRVPVTINQLNNQVTIAVKSDPGAQVTVLILP